MYTQEPLREKIQTGKHLGFDVEPKIIQTLISNVYLCGDKVYKIYKDDSVFFNTNLYDISSKEERHEFTRKDFDWNSTVTPEVYTEIKGVRLDSDGNPEWTDSDNAEELVIVMNKIDMSQGFMNLLLEDGIELDKFYEIGLQLGDRLKRLKDVPNDKRSFEEIMESLIGNLGEWIGSVQEYKGISDKYVTWLQDFFENRRDEFAQNKDLSECVDLHAENAAYVDGNLLPFDLFPPKPEWRKSHKDTGFYRLGTDVYALCGEEAFNKIREGYQESVDRKLDDDYISFWIMYSSVIMAPYMYMLAEHDPKKLDGAKKYQKFIEDYYQRIK